MSIAGTIEKYENQLALNPSSRVFAPLAEAYRKAGMVEKALEVLSQNIKKSPSYVSGFLVLAHCYSDLGRFDKAFETINSIVNGNLENIQLQRLYANVCIQLEYRDLALEKFKYLLFLNPKDLNIQKRVKELEDSPMETSESADESSQKEVNLFDENKLVNDPPLDSKKDLDGWVAVDLSTSNLSSAPNLSEDFSPLKEFPLEEEIEPEVEEAQESEVAPFMTHTLVDLYLVQGHVDKAIEVLEKILVLNPSDERSRKKLLEVSKSYPTFAPSESELEHPLEEAGQSEEENREYLMDLIDSKVHKASRGDIEAMFWKFHKMLKTRSKHGPDL